MEIADRDIEEQAAQPGQHRVAEIAVQERHGARRDTTPEPVAHHQFRATAQLGQETGSEPNVSGSLKDVGQDPARVLDLANEERIGQKLDAETNAARELGIFGSPTFSVGRELFWGDDRLEDAISWDRWGCVVMR